MMDVSQVYEFAISVFKVAIIEEGNFLRADPGA